VIVEVPALGGARCAIGIEEPNTFSAGIPDIKLNKNTFIISDWGGKIQLVVLGKSPEKLLESKTHAADLGYIPSEHLLLVPTFTENQLAAYRLELDK
jgi:hypothetical protein